MKPRRFFIDLVVAGGVLVGVQMLQGMLFQNVLEAQDQLLAVRLERSMVSVLNKAHKAKDDLAIYDLTSALAQSPGILQSYVIDSNNRIIAYRQPSQLGRVLVCPLKEGAREWGRLFLAVSDRYARQWVNRQRLIGSAAAIFLWSVLFAYLRFLDKRSSTLHGQIADLNSLLQSEKRKVSALQEREQLAAFQSSARLQRAIQRIPEPLIVLDPQQRVAGVNQSALSWLNAADPSALLRKSWNEVTLLESCGAGLERSLAFPGHSVDWPCPEAGGWIRFDTDPDGLAGTWITFVSGERKSATLVL